jgi:cell division septation protein DedD
MRDAGRWQDKVELSLDNRQIYFLFFGTAVAACLVFTVGVLVGKRLEAGARPPAAPSDQLAALDRLGSAPREEGLTFHRALVDSRPTTTDALAPERARPERRPGRETAPPPKLRAAEVPLVPPAQARDRRLPTRPAPVAEPVADGEHAERPERYVLQLAPVPGQKDAETTVRRLAASGYQPYLVSSGAGGKASYRVRLGEFSSRRAAESAKASFRQRHGAVAFVNRVQ